MDQEDARSTKEELQDAQTVHDQRSARSEAPEAISAGDVVLYPQSRRVLQKGKALRLTDKEFLLLELFMRRVNTPVAREVLCERLWGTAHENTSNFLEAHVKNLRRKLRDKERTLVKTVWGKGYMFIGKESV